jgi:hypothetical protein
MKIKGLNAEQIQKCAEAVGAIKVVDLRPEGRFLRFTLRMAINMGKDGYRKASREALRFRKRGFSAVMRGSDGFGGNAVCFHGHYLFIQAQPGGDHCDCQGALPGIRGLPEQGFPGG